MARTELEHELVYENAQGNLVGIEIQVNTDDLTNAHYSVEKVVEALESLPDDWELDPY